METEEKLPAHHGFFMPAEWHPHKATWIAWPHNITDWPGKFHPIPWVFAEVVKHLSECEEVIILVTDARMERQARRILDKADAIRGPISFVCSPTNRCWTRDSLPTFVVNPKTHQLGAVKWHFNGWAKYQDWREDDTTGEYVSRRFAECCWLPQDEKTTRRIVLEGGAIDTNGKGMLLTTEECLLSQVQERNPGFDRKSYETIFSDYLGIEQVIWLAGGIDGDDTHGHIDDVARFVDEQTIALAVETDKTAPHYSVLRENQRRLRQLQVTFPDLEIIELPLPRPVMFDGQRLPASYANFYISNAKVLVPTFNDANDRLALNALQTKFQDRTVVGIHSLDLVLGLGTLHCMTQPQPAVTVH